MDNYNRLIADLYQNQELNDCIHKFIPATHREDFKQELFLILLEKPHEEIIRISETGKLVYYVVRIILNLYRQERNVFHTKYLDKRIEYDTEKTNSFQPEVEYFTIDKRQELEELEERFLQELDGIDGKMGGIDYPYYQSLVELIVKYGSMAEVSRQTGIPKCTISRSVKRVRNYLNDNVR